MYNTDNWLTNSSGLWFLLPHLSLSFYYGLSVAINNVIVYINISRQNMCQIRRLQTYFCCFFSILYSSYFRTIFISVWFVWRKKKWKITGHISNALLIHCKIQAFCICSQQQVQVSRTYIYFAARPTYIFRSPFGFGLSLYVLRKSNDLYFAVKIGSTIQR